MSNTKKSPLQIVSERFGSKKELAKHLAETLEPATGESKDELTNRLALASNAKLLHLEAIAQKVAAHGGREGLVNKIAAVEKKTGDQDYLKALTEKRTLGWLVDRVEMHAKRARQAS
jgi:hypothetical protein